MLLALPRRNQEGKVGALKGISSGFLFPLPLEVKTIIYNMLNQSEARQLRLVCRQTRQEIDTCFLFNVMLTEFNPNLDRILGLKIKECKILKLFGPLPAFPIFDEYLRLEYPALIRTLHILFQAYSPDGSNISPHQQSTSSSALLDRLLSSVTRKIKNVKILFNHGLVFQPHSNHEGHRFPNMQQISIKVEIMDYIHDIPVSPQNSVSWLMETCEMPNLKRLTYRLKVSTAGFANDLLATLLRYLLRPKAKALESLDVKLYDEHLNIPMTAFSNSNLKNCTWLHKLEFLKLFQVHFVIGGVWDQLVRVQTGLKAVQLNFIGFPMPHRLIRTIAFKNYNTLIEIFISDIETLMSLDGRKTPLDLALFKDCVSLQALYMHRGNRPNQTANGPDITNFSQLPKNLVQLSLISFSIQTDDLLGFDAATSVLQEVELCNSGHNEEYGVTGPVLEHFMTMNRMRLIEVDAFNVDDVSGKLALLAIMFNLNIPIDATYDALQLSLVRDQSDPMWRNGNL